MTETNRNLNEQDGIRFPKNSAQTGILQRTGILCRFAWLPIPAFLMAIAILAHLDSGTVWNPHHLLAVLNIMFLTCIAAVISILAARSYLSGHSSIILFFGSGMLALSLGSAMAGFYPGKPDPNWTVTVYNLSAFLMSLCILTGTMTGVFAQPRRLMHGWPVLASFYCGITVIELVLVLAAYYSLLPVFFAEGQGATKYDILVLGATSSICAISALWLLINFRTTRSAFPWWYALGLGLIAAGLMGVSLQTRFGSPLNWTGRAAQYLGGVYLLIAVISSARRNGSWLLPLEKALHESETRYRSLVESSPDGIVVHRNGEFLYANASALRMHGADSIEQLRERNVLDMVQPEDRPEVKERIRQASAGQDMPLRETRLIGLDSRVTTVEVAGGPVNYQGEPAVQVILRDITERKKAEEDMARSEARFRLLSETSGMLLAAENPQNIINELCRRVMEHLDCQAFFNFLVDEEASRLHLNASAGIPEDEARRIEWLDYGVAVCGCAALEESRIIAEDIANTPDPRTELIRSYGIQAYCCHPLLAQGRVIGTLSFGTRTRPRFSQYDIDLMKTVADQVAIAMQRLLSQKQMEEAQQTLKTLMEHVPDGITIADAPDLNIRMVSRYGQELLGVNHHGLTAEKVVNRWKVFHEDGETPMSVEDLPLTQAVRRGEIIRNMELVQVSDTGKNLTLLCNAAPVRDSSGTILGGIVAWRDITERKQDELRIQKYVEELKDTNEELTCLNSAMTGREIRMIELKEEVNELCSRSGLPPRYPLDFMKGQP